MVVSTAALRRYTYQFGGHPSGCALFDRGQQKTSQDIPHELPQALYTVVLQLHTTRTKLNDGAWIGGGGGRMPSSACSP